MTWLLSHLSTNSWGPHSQCCPQNPKSEANTCHPSLSLSLSNFSHTISITDWRVCVPFYSNCSTLSLSNTSHKLYIREVSIWASLNQFSKVWVPALQVMNMARQNSCSRRLPKFRSQQRCSRFFQERRARFYIMWRCTVILLRWNE